MKRNIKEIFKKSVGGIMAAAAVLSAIPMITYAAADYLWEGSVATPGSSIYTDIAVKCTSSSMYAMYISGGSTYVGATAWASTTTGNFSDVTLYTSAHPNYLISKGSSSYVEVLNLAYENYGQCYARMRFVTDNAGQHCGYWKADN